MIDLEMICELWDDLSIPEPKCTRLFHLKPIGVGTPEVEAFSSYIARLAREHNVRLWDLLRDEILVTAREISVNTSNILNGKTINALRRIGPCINGINTTTKVLQTAVAQLTGNDQLLNLTMLPFSGVISPRGLLRENHAWCPNCYEKQRQDFKIPYDLLLWSFTDVCWCLEHDYALQYTCPYCSCTIKRLPHTYQPGYCPHCDSWLGSKNPQITAMQQLETIEIETMKFYAQAMSDLIAVAPSLIVPPDVDPLRRGIRSGIATLDGGNLSRFSSRLGLLPAQMGWLLKDQKKYSTSFLLRICQTLGISLKHLLVDGILHYLAECPRDNSTRHRRTPRKVDSEALRTELEKYAIHEPPLSLREIGRRLTRTPTILKRHAPQTCQIIVARFEDYQQALHQQLQQGIEFGLKEVLSSSAEPPASVERIIGNLGIRPSTVYSMYYDLCTAIAKKQLEYFAMQTELEKQRLQRNIDTVVNDLHERKCYPSRLKVLAELENPPRFGWTLVNEMRKNAMCKLGYSV
jgi:hypothetical protein